MRRLEESLSALTSTGSLSGTVRDDGLPLDSVSYELDTMYQKYNLNSTGTSWMDTSASPPCKRTLRGMQEAAGSVLDETGALSERYFAKRGQSFSNLKKGLNPLAIKRREVDWSKTRVPMSKRISVLAMRGYKDLMGQKDGKLHPDVYQKAPGLDKAVFHDGAVISSQRQKADAPPRTEKPPAITEKPGMSSETFHTWYLRTKRKDKAQVEQEGVYYTHALEQEERSERDAIYTEWGDFHVFCCLVLHPTTCTHVKLTKALRFLGRYKTDVQLCVVALRAIRDWVREAWSSSQFVSRGGVTFLANIASHHNRLPLLVTYVVQSITHIVSYPHSHAQVLSSNILFHLIHCMFLHQQNQPVMFHLVQGLYSLVAHSPLHDFVMIILSSPDGLPLVVSTMDRYQTREQYFVLCLKLVSKLATSPLSYELLVAEGGIRRILGITTGLYPDNLVVKQHLAKTLYNIMSGCSRTALSLQGVGSWLLDSVLRLAQHDFEKNMNAYNTMKTVLEAITRYVSNQSDRSCCSLTHAAPAVLQPLVDHPSFGAKVQACLSRLNSAIPIVTKHAIQLGLHGALYAEYRPVGDIQLISQFPNLQPHHEKRSSAVPFIFHGWLTPPGCTAEVRCFFCPKESPEHEIQEAFLQEIQLRWGLSHDCLCSLLGWSVDEGVPLVPVEPGVKAPEAVPSRILYILLEGGGQNLSDFITELREEHERAVLEWCGEPPNQPTLKDLLRDFEEHNPWEELNELRLVVELADEDLQLPQPVHIPGIGVTYGQFLEIAFCITRGLRYLHRSGCCHRGLTPSDVVQGEASEWKLRWPTPTTLKSGEVQRDIHSLGRTLAEVIFFSSEAHLRHFLDTGNFPSSMSSLAMHSILGPCLGFGTQVINLRVPSADELLGIIADVRTILQLSEVFRRNRAGDEELSLTSFIAWAETCVNPKIGEEGDHEQDVMPHFETIPPGRLGAVLRKWECMEMKDIPVLSDYITTWG